MAKFRLKETIEKNWHENRPVNEENKSVRSIIGVDTVLWVSNVGMNI